MKLCGLWMLIVVLLGGCETTTYHWGTYEYDLLRYYKQPETEARFRQKLKKTLVKGEDQQRVPAGLYAEMGYLLLKSGQNEEAIRYFEKEKAKWPESGRLMDRLIGLAAAGGIRQTSPPDS